jgi:hypothetical protein
MSPGVPTPVVFRVLLCWKSEPSKEVPGAIAIHGLIDTIRVRGNFPCLLPGLCVFAQFTDGSGTHQPQLRIIREEDNFLVTLIPLQPFTMPPGRLIVFNRDYRLPPIPFPTPGNYQFRVVCGESVQSHTVRVERIT